MSGLSRSSILALTVLVATVAGFIGAAETPQPDGKKYALLVGCTKYQLEAVRALDGPLNDVPLWNKLLTSPTGFGFEQKNITRLVGWPDNAQERPTYANIIAGFEDLVAKAGPDVQIFILLSGHGVTLPIPETQLDALDPQNPEPDGLDEVFLPADVQSWDQSGGTGVGNVIRDDLIGAWLDKMRGRGASVWIVFDCCHAGSMTRGTHQEKGRSVDCASLGVPRAAIEHAARRSREALAKAGAGQEATRGLMNAKPSPLNVQPDAAAPGKLVAFYGCQSFEESPELPRPRGAEEVPENYYGLMSYTLIKTLEERQGPLTYRELAQILLARYKAERATRAPTPFAEGDLNREVLGLTVWPNRPDIVLRRAEDKLTIDAGELRGLTPGSVLTVYPPAGDARGDELVLGYLRVETATPVLADVVPCDATGAPGGDPDKLPDLARCQILSQDLGDLRVKLALVPEDKLRPAFDQLDAKVRAMVQVVPEAQAEWLLRQVTPQEAAEVFLLEGVQEDRVLLLPTEGGSVTDAARKEAHERRQAAGKQNLRKIYGGYAAGELKPLVANLERDLQKVFKVQSLWRVAGGLGGNADLSPEHGLRFDVLLMKDANDRQGAALATPSITTGQILGFQIKNEGAELLWYTALYCDADFKIEVWGSGQIRPGQTLSLSRAQVSEGTSGTEGMIVLALPVAVSNEAPDFTFLEQEALGKAEDATKTRGAVGGPRSPFGRLMAGAAFNNGTRAASKLVPTTPAIRSMNWVVLPTEEPPSN